MSKKLIFSKKAIYLLGGSLLLLVAAFAVHSFYGRIMTEDRITNKIQEKVLDKEQEVDRLLGSVLEDLSVPDAYPDFKYLSDALRTLDEKNVTVFAFRSDSLIFWTDNSVQVETRFRSNPFSEPLINISNGWFDLRIKQEGALTFAAFIRVKMDYPYENDYLSNGFASHIRAPGEIGVRPVEGDHNIFNSEGQFLFSLDYSSHASIPHSVESLAAILFILSFLVFLSALYYGYKYMGLVFRSKFLLFLGYAADAVLIRFLVLYFGFPEFITHASLFHPQYFASSPWAPSLGDLFLNLATLFAIGYAFFHMIHTGRILEKAGRHVQTLVANVFLLFILVSFFLLIDGLQGIIRNSGFSLNLADITSINLYSVAGFFCFSLFLFIFILYTFKPALFVFQFYRSSWQSFLLPALYLTGFGIPAFSYLGFDLIYLVFLALYLFIVWYISNLLRTNKLFASTVLFILLFSILSTYLLNQGITQKEKATRSVLAEEFISQKDPMLEYKFSVASDTLRSDTALLRLLEGFPFGPAEYDFAIDLIYQKYFSDFSAGSDVWLTLCDPGWGVATESDTIFENCFEFFNRAVADYGSPTDFDDLYFIDKERDEDNYLGVIRLPLEGMDLRLYVEVFNKYLSQNIGFSELLVDKRSERGRKLADYSYCRYENGGQISQIGGFFYPTTLAEYNLPDTTRFFFNAEGYNHYLYSPDGTSTVLLSRKNPGLIDLVAPFSYVSIFLGVMAFIFFILFRGPGSIRFTPVSFKKQTQLTITAIIVFSFLIVGLGSLYYITSLNHSKNISILQEKSNSVLIELKHKLEREGWTQGEMEGHLSAYLVKFSLVFFTDINLYDLDGQLLATSARGVFRRGLASRTMNSAAYLNMHGFGKSLFIHREKIGEYGFLSAYRPLRDENARVVAYLNLPYFAKQDTLTNEITTFLVAFINVYVILIAFSIYLALVISNYITKPIEMLREKIGRLKFGNTVEKIEWKRQDEIGSLIEEYNRMVDELARSAELLAKSERESAWREMAKQIAHEIKNPLTPMKLSVQYLQKAWDEKAPDWEDRLQRFTNTIIEQINSLSVIASEFSDFAKMPRSNFRDIDLVEIINNSIGIFRESSQVRFEFEFSGVHRVHADKEQLLRVFNNLIKNSLQAIQDPGKGLIRILIRADDSHHNIEFADNGKGIPEEMREKVFYPNFTTKSGGMGLGLAMAKSIIENARGTIRFESEVDVGTTFFITLPKTTSHQ